MLVILAKLVLASVFVMVAVTVHNEARFVRRGDMPPARWLSAVGGLAVASILLAVALAVAMLSPSVLS